jgi:small-conductance mechanosensitive channel
VALLLALSGAPPARAQAVAPAIARIAGTAPAAPAAAAPILTPAQTKQVLEVLQDDAKRAQFIAVLENMGKALPPAEDAPLRPDGVFAQLIQVLDSLSAYAAAGSARLLVTAQAVTDFPLLLHWLSSIADDPDAKAQLLDVGWKLAVVALVGGLVEAGSQRALRRSRRLIDTKRDIAPIGGAAEDDAASTADDAPCGSAGPESTSEAPDPAQDAAPAPPPAAHRRPLMTLRLLRLLPYILARLVIDLAPLVLFAAVAYGLLGTPIGRPATAHLVIEALVNAYLLYRLTTCAARLLVSPQSPRLRLLHISTESAVYIMRWVGRLTAIIAFGYALNAFAIVFGLYPSARDALLKLVALLGHIYAVVIVLQCRKSVAAWLAPPADKRGMFANLRRRLARRWHFLAIFYIVALWLVWALEVRDGFSRLLHFFVVTVLVLSATRALSIMALGALDRTFALPADADGHEPGFLARAARYHPLLRGTLTGLITALTLLALFEVWGLDPIGWFTGGALGGQLVSALVAIGCTLLIALVVWEFSNAAIDHRLEKLSRDQQAARSARLRTLLPMLRTTLFFIIMIVTGMMVLSQIGVNTAPLLAGAGVVGVALGFGSQKLVQDIITGLFLLLENAMQVGDTVNLAGLTGVVEYLSVRTIRLRALDGSVHIIPFSAVTSVTNMTRDYAYAIIDVELGHNEEPDAVADILRDIAEEMREQPAWKLALIADLEVMGVEKFTDLGWMMRVRIRTQPTRRWAVQREFNRRIKYRFDARSVEAPFTATRVLASVPTAAVEAVKVPAQ